MLYNLTILMPIYNQQAYLHEAIDSVLMQKTDYKYQLILLNDGSTDNSLQIMEEYQKKNPQIIKIISNDMNLGLFSTIMKGYVATKTDYFCVLDPDDYYISDDKFQKALTFLENNKDFTIYAASCYLEQNGERTLWSGKAGNYAFDDLPRIPLGNTTCSIFKNVVFANGLPEKLIKINKKTEAFFRNDSFRNVLHLRYGKIHFSTDVESVYRITNSGIWTSLNKFEQNNFNAQAYLAYKNFFNDLKTTYFDYMIQIFLTDNLKYIANKINNLQPISLPYELIAELYVCYDKYLNTDIVYYSKKFSITSKQLNKFYLFGFIPLPFSKLSIGERSIKILLLKILHIKVKRNICSRKI